MLIFYSTLISLYKNYVGLLEKDGFTWDRNKKKKIEENTKIQEIKNYNVIFILFRFDKFAKFVDLI